MLPFLKKARESKKVSLLWYLQIFHFQPRNWEKISQPIFTRSMNVGSSDFTWKLSIFFITICKRDFRCRISFREEKVWKLMPSKYTHLIPSELALTISQSSFILFCCPLSITYYVFIMHDVMCMCYKTQSEQYCVKTMRVQKKFDEKHSHRPTNWSYDERVIL